MEVCIKDIRKWLTDGHLLLNDTKTEFLVIGTRQQLSKLCSSSIEVGNQKIGRSSGVRNLGVMLDESLGMNSHINQICKASLYHIHNIILSVYRNTSLDYCNSITAIVYYMGYPCTSYRITTHTEYGSQVYNGQTKIRSY